MLVAVLKRREARSSLVIDSTFLAGVLMFLAFSCGGKAMDETAVVEGAPTSPVGQAEVGDEEAQQPGAQVSECASGAWGASKVRGLKAAQVVDAISFVELTTEHLVERVVEQWGEACPQAAAGSTCLSEIPERLTGFYVPNSSVGHALIVTRNGEQEALGYWGIRDFLGEIDTANEAALLAWTEGWVPSCAEIREQKGGYLIPGSPECSEDGWVTLTTGGEVSHSAFCRSLK
jgi:hypothetical protein